MKMDGDELKAALRLIWPESRQAARPFRENFESLAAWLACLPDDGLRNRSGFREELAETEKAAHTILKKLRDARILTSLNETDEDGIEDWRELINGCSRLIRRVQMTATKLPQGQGRHRARLNASTLSNRELCALIILESWVVARGKPNCAKVKPIGPGVATAHKAADSLWRATRPDEPTGDGQSFWRRAFEAAHKAYGPQRDFIRSSLTASYKNFDSDIDVLLLPGKLAAQLDKWASEQKPRLTREQAAQTAVEAFLHDKTP